MGKVNHDKRLHSFTHSMPKSPSQALITQSNSQIKIWHEWFCHLSFHYLQQLFSKHMVKGLPNINFSKGECSSCLVNMHLEEKYDKGKSSRAPFVLQLVHMVLASHFAVTSVSQDHYILTFIDDFSHFTWVYFLHHKNKMVNKLQDFKSHVEWKSRKSIKVLWMDNESRYVDKRLKHFCKLEVIDL